MKICMLLAGSACEARGKSGQYAPMVTVQLWVKNAHDGQQDKLNDRNYHTQNHKPQQQHHCTASARSYGEARHADISRQHTDQPIC